MSFLQKKKDFLLGLFLGLVVMSFFVMMKSDRQPLTDKTADESIEDVIVAKPTKIKAVQSAEMNTTLKKVEVLRRPAQLSAEEGASQVLAESVKAPSEPVVETTTKKQMISLSTHLVRQMEKEWSSLRHQAQLQSQPGGWRVLYVQPNSTFAQTGLQPGDFIRHEYVQQMRAKDDSGEQLSDRVVRIFSYIE